MKRADPLPPLASGVVALAAAAPWVLGFSDSHAAVANGIAFAMAFAPLALLVGALRPASAVCMAGSAWLAASPWVLGYSSAGVAAWGANLLLGATLAALSWRAAAATAQTTLPQRERHLGHATPSHAARLREEQTRVERGSRAA